VIGIAVVRRGATCIGIAVAASVRLSLIATRRRTGLTWILAVRVPVAVAVAASRLHWRRGIRSDRRSRRARGLGGGGVRCRRGRGSRGRRGRSGGLIAARRGGRSACRFGRCLHVCGWCRVVAVAVAVSVARMGDCGSNKRHTQRSAQKKESCGRPRPPTADRHSHPSPTSHSLQAPQLSPREGPSNFTDKPTTRPRTNTTSSCNSNR
jgi:hypothetical protein